LVSINTVDLISIAIYGVPVSSLFDQEATIPEDIRGFIRIAVHLTAGTMEDIPITGTALNRHIAERIVEKVLAVDTAYQISVFVCQIPGIASSDTVIAVIEQIDLIAVEDGRVIAVDIYPVTGRLDYTTVPEILVIFETTDRFAGGYFVTGVFKPQVILVGNDILRRHRDCGKQSCYE
jgi:hypothetical protein